MTNSLRDARICLALTAAFAAVGIYFAAQPSWWCLPALYIATLLGWCQRRLIADHHRQLRVHDRARRAARTDALRIGLADDLARQPAISCCSFWVHSEGKIHAPDCTGTAA